MTHPTEYARTFGFETFQSGHPTTSLPGNEVDDEFDEVSRFTSEVLDRLKLIQRDDGALANRSVGIDQMKTEVQIGVNPPSLWATATVYANRDSVFQGNAFYVAQEAHTSGTFATDLANGKWVLAADFSGLSAAAAASAAAALASELAAAASASDAADSEANAASSAAAAASSASASASSALSSAGGASDAAASAVAANADRILAEAAAASVASAAVRPIALGGTGATTADGALLNLGGGTVGINAFKASTAATLRDVANLATVPVDGTEFGFVAGDAAGANAATNDAAYVAWMASSTPAIWLSKGIYEISATMAHNVDGKTLYGVAGQNVFGDTAATDGTVFRWHGAAGGSMWVARSASTTEDLLAPGIYGISMDGNSLAGAGFAFAGVMKPHGHLLHVRNLRDNAASYGFSFSHNSLATGSQVNCCFGGNFGILTAHVTGSANGFLLTGKSATAGTGVTFCQFDYCHVTCTNGYSFVLQKGDDNVFTQIGVSRGAGGTNGSMLYNTNKANLMVWVGNKIHNMNLSKTDGAAMQIVVADDATMGNEITYNGVDFAPTLVFAGGAVLGDNKWRFLGQSNYAGGWTTEPYENMFPLPNANDTNPKILDWYEEGTVTAPTIAFGGASVGMTFGTRFINWTRIGNRVFFNASITLTAKGSSTGSATITGLPYASTSNGGAISIGYYGSFASAITPIGMAATSSITLRKFGAATAVDMTDADFTATTRIDFGGHYQVA